MEKETKTETKVDPKRDVGLWIGVMAIIINIITVSVYMYQARIMQEQQHASAWPYLEWLPSFNEETYFIEISNNGIGPAIINNVDINWNGKHFTDIDSVFQHAFGTSYFPHITSTVLNRVLPAGKSIRLVQVNDAKWANKVFAEFRKSTFSMNLCYASIYGDTWLCRGVEVSPGECP
ncbi:MAG: hypothetical protein ACKO96_30145 [Flammeovirgaceae bacterium]